MRSVEAAVAGSARLRRSDAGRADRFGQAEVGEGRGGHALPRERHGPLLHRLLRTQPDEKAVHVS
ncbi:hypothetical protein [Streptomyces sp. NPDC006270]|uniref:hypothetical protein n=1 Tax=Streptomyces sp. NPDC006270 TaxID=3364741 RepID=UPI0036C6A2E7